ncbi:MAG: Mu transposase domain-containing protein [Janthinobacterium lividum]
MAALPGGLDYHVEVYGYFYSVPYRLMREVIEARITDQTIELYHQNNRVACHVRNPRHYRRRPHAERAPPPRRVDAHAAAARGRGDRAVHHRPGGAHPGRQAASRAGRRSTRFRERSSWKIDRRVPRLFGILRLMRGYGPERLEEP